MAKTNWQYAEIVTENDLNQIGQEINENTEAMVENQLTTLPLVHGAQIITAPRTSPARVKIPGDTQTNLMGRAGRFASGTVDWFNNNTTFSVSNGIASIISAGQFAGISFGVNVIQGHKYYLRGKVRASTNLVILSLQRSDLSPFFSVQHSGSGGFEILSVIGELTGTVSGSFVYFSDARESGWNEILATDIMLIDLTAKYGVGNEPTKVWCDANLPYIDSIQHLTGAYVHVGSSALPFEEQQESHLYVMDSLGEGETYQDGRKNKVWERKVLDGSSAWGVDGTPMTGYKGIFFPSTALNNPLSLSELVVKNDGKILKHSPTSGYYVAGADRSFLHTNFNITVSNADSGWGDSYTPTPDEIKAYFMGWTMYSSPSNTVYNGSGTKTWAKIYCGIGTRTTIHDLGVVLGSGDVITVPTVMNDQGWTPYVLHYIRATPVTVPVQTEGSLMLSAGANTVTLGEGVVVREVAKPQYDISGVYVINNADQNSWLKYFTTTSFVIYKNTERDTKWTTTPRNTQHGTWAGIPAADYDPFAVYTVTYLAEPYQLTTLALSAELTYAENLGTVVQETVIRVSEVEAGLSSTQANLIITLEKVSEVETELSTTQADISIIREDLQHHKDDSTVHHIITVSTSSPSTYLGEGVQHQVYT